MNRLKSATAAVVKAAKELHTASKLEELACHQPNSDAHAKADRRLSAARGRHYNAVEALLKLEAPKVVPKAPEKIHYSGGLRWVTGTKLTRLLAGSPACTLVRKADDNRKLSEDFRKVTCLRCLHLIKLAENSS